MAHSHGSRDEPLSIWKGEHYLGKLAMDVDSKIELLLHVNKLVQNGKIWYTCLPQSARSKSHLVQLILSTSTTLRAKLYADSQRTFHGSLERGCIPVQVAKIFAQDSVFKALGVVLHCNCLDEDRTAPPDHKRQFIAHLGSIGNVKGWDDISSPEFQSALSRLQNQREDAARALILAAQREDADAPKSAVLALPRHERSLALLLHAAPFKERRRIQNLKVTSDTPATEAELVELLFTSLKEQYLLSTQGTGTLMELGTETLMELQAPEPREVSEILSNMLIGKKPSHTSTHAT